MEPVNSNSLSKSCPEPIGSDCVIVSADMSPLGLCGGTNSLTSVLIAETNELNSLIQQLQLTDDQLSTLQASNNTVQPPLDFSSLDLGCLYSSTITSYSCPCGAPLSQAYVPGVSGNPGYCGILGPTGTGVFVAGVGWIVAASSCVPVLTTIPNPIAKPNTLVGILQLMINRIPCCDPCSKNNP